MPDSERADRTMAHSRLDYWLLIGDHAQLAWLVWFSATMGAMLATAVRGPFVAHIPYVGPVVPTVMTVLAVLWFFAGASVGWVPRRL